MQFLFASAASAEPSGNILTSLGIDWRLFVSQAIAFGILLAILYKFVYPPLIKSIDKRRESIEAGLEEARQAQESLAEAEERVEKLLADARKEADEIVARSQAEAAAAIAESETKAKQRAERIVTDARSQLEADVIKARAALKRDAMKLVAMATERVVGQKLDGAQDNKLIEAAIKAEDRA